MNSARGIKKSWQDHCNHSLTHSLTHYKQLLIVAILLTFAGCIGKNNIEVTLKNPKKTTTESLNITVSNVQVINHQIIITGTNLTAVSNFKVKEGSTSNNLQIESQTSTSIVANTISNVTFAAGRVFDFILSSANASATFNVNFSLCDSTLGGMGFNCSITPNDKEVLAFDTVSGKWKPRAVNGLSYQGTWDASGAAPASTTAGDYYIVSVAGAGYAVGDWSVCRGGATYDKISNSNTITNVFGRTGAVAATKGDYTLTKMADVDLITTPPSTGEVLKYDGTNWVPGTVAAGGGGTVTTVSGTAPISVSNGSSTPVISIPAATTTVSGYLTTADWNTFNGKEPGITAQATTKVFRGDKTFVTLDTSIVPENGNLYYTDVRALAAPITAPTLTNSSIATSDTIQIALGKLQAQFNNVLNIALTSLSTATSSAITAADSILVALGKLQAQITSTNASYVAKAGGSTLAGTTTLTGTIAVSTGLGRITIVDAPAIATDVANKAYVDSAISSPSVTCPTGYVLVPANTTYFSKQFCVMKYAASNDGYGTAVSVATGAPWVSIDRPTSRSACQALGQGYDMISNDQWQVVARNIAGVAVNWSTGTVASGQLSNGHSDNAPASALTPSADDVAGNCSGTGQTCSSTVWDSQRRTNVLSNGNMIWDFTGNVWQWVTNNNTVVNGADGYISTMSAADIRQTRYGALSSTICATPGATPYCGMGIGYFNYSAGAVRRGGGWGNGVNAGVFAASLSAAPTTSYTNVGFRCVFVP